MTPRTLRIYRTRFTFEEDDGEQVYAEVDEHGLPVYDEKHIDCEPDGWDTEEGISALDKAERYLRDESIVAPSSSPPFTQGDWFSYVDEREEVSAHPEGFSDDEMIELGRRLSS